MVSDQKDENATETKTDAPPASGESTTETAPAEPAHKVEETSTKKPRVEVTALPTRQYLDQTVVPILLQALNVIAKERPGDPIQFLADYLVKNKSQFESSTSS